MNSAKTTTKKKISEYQIEDIKEIFLNIFKKISSNQSIVGAVCEIRSLHIIEFSRKQDK